MFDFDFAVGIYVGVSSSAVGWKIFVINAETKKYKVIIKKNEKKHYKIVLLPKPKLNSIEVLILIL